MTKPAQMIGATVLGLIMTVFSVISKASKVPTSVHATASMLSPAEKQACRELIHQTLLLGSEESHHEVAKALAIGRERLPRAKRASEKACEEAVAQ